MAMLQTESVARSKNYGQHIFVNMMSVILIVKRLVAQRSFDRPGARVNRWMTMLIFFVVAVVAYCRA
jgi:hypothetical protein